MNVGMFLVANGYVFAVLGWIMLVEHHSMLQSVAAPGWASCFVYLIPVAMTGTTFTSRASIYSGLLLTVSVYYSIFSTYYYTQVLFDTLRPAIFDILRYHMFFYYALSVSKSLDEALNKLPMYSLVSNLGYVLEYRSNDLVKVLGISNYLCEASFACMLLSTCLLYCIKSNSFENNILLPSEFKHKRAAVNSTLSFCSACTTVILLNSISTYQPQALRNFTPYDYIPITSAFLAVVMNKEMHKYLPYSVCAVVCPVLYAIASVSLLCGGNNVPDFAAKTAYIFIASLRYVVYDTTRLALFVTQQCEVISRYQACDAVTLGVSQGVCLLASSYASVHVQRTICLIVSCVWFVCARCSLKYYYKDIKCTACIELMQNNV